MPQKGLPQDCCVKCNFCEKDFDMWDKQENFGFHHMVGYGSKFDMTELKLNLCCDCFDKMMEEYILPQSRIDPIIDDDTFPRMKLFEGDIDD